jgi:hypothetical protein
MEDTRGKELVKDLLIIPDVQRRIQKERDNPKKDGLWWIMHNYNIPVKYQDVMKFYIEENELDFSLISEPVLVDVSNGVSLRLSRDTIKEELLGYIEEHWSDEISPALEEVNMERRERLPIPYHPEQDRQIYTDYLNKKKLGLTNQGVATRNNTNITKVKRVIERFKRLGVARS